MQSSRVFKKFSLLCWVNQYNHFHLKVFGLKCRGYCLKVTYWELLHFILLTTLLLSLTGTCVKKLDIVVVLDDSTSEGIDGFHSIKEFVIGLIRDMEEGPDKTSVCLIRVHLNPTVEFNFKNYSSKLMNWKWLFLSWSTVKEQQVILVIFVTNIKLIYGLVWYCLKNGNSLVAFVFMVSCNNLGHKKNLAASERLNFFSWTTAHVLVFSSFLLE